jgi:hypothetical protein
MYNPLKSKTNLLQLAIIAMAVLNAVVPFVPVQYQDIITALLAMLAIITHTSTAVRAGATN